ESDKIKKKNVSAVVIQFSEEFIKNFTGLPEFKNISRLLAASHRGLFFPLPGILQKEIEALPEQSGMEKITRLLTILQNLSVLESTKLSSEYFSAIKGEKTEKRINKVCVYIQKNAGKNITLEQSAALIHLSRSAFSKFFKRATGKTFSDYVNDIRIGNACYLLTESDKSINEIAHEAGFESLTYFNRVFLKKKGVTPRDFRNAHASMRHSEQ
ncbi:MAG TPA: AraC family transcriptional regulator, partial [Cyclobacteriaceae bacterium]|nr:AraC family transcriptional regulator [Cyclobacteriaceae bacterium]